MNINFQAKNRLSSFLTNVEKKMHIPGPSVVVLAYHTVSDNKTIVDVDPKVFKQQLEFLKKNFKFITLDKVIDYVYSKKTFNKPAVALTFDDGYKEVFTTIAPILAKEKIPATVFVLSNPSQANRAELENDKKLMSIQEIKHLQKLGWIIGCHSATHSNFFVLNLDFDKEIYQSKKLIEKKLRTSIKYFAYPKGLYNSFIIDQVKSAGYTASFAFEAGFISYRTNLMKIPRLPVDWTHSMAQFEAFFTNWGTFYFLAKQKLQKGGLFLEK